MNFEVIPDQQTPLTPQIEDISSFLKDNADSIEKFKEYADSRFDGIGLAANQCSLDGERYNLRLIAVKDSSQSGYRKSLIAVDPVIVEVKGRKCHKAEGCLTWKGKTILAERYPYIEVEYFDTEGNKHKVSAKGFQAQVWQHEINHINGVEENVLEGSWERFRMPDDLKLEKLERNDPCSCGSGKKYKKCCGQYDL